MRNLIKMILKIPTFIVFLIFYIEEVVRANLQVAYDILTPKHFMKPGVIAIKMDVESDMEILSLNNLITMTPGTLSLDVSTDRKVIYVHAMYIYDTDELKKQIKSGLEKKIMRLFR